MVHITKHMYVCISNIFKCMIMSALYISKLVYGTLTRMGI